MIRLKISFILDTESAEDDIDLLSKDFEEIVTDLFSDEGDVVSNFEVEELEDEQK